MRFKCRVQDERANAPWIVPAPVEHRSDIFNISGFILSGFVSGGKLGRDSSCFGVATCGRQWVQGFTLPQSG